MAFELITASPWFESIVTIILVLFIASLIFKWISYALTKMRERWDLDITLVQALHEIFKYSVYGLALVIILKELGFDITAIAVSLGIFGIAIGFGARDTISNLISGLFILADKSLKVGDIIEISNQKGKVEKLGFRTTTLITYDKRMIKVPNSIFSSSPYISYTASEMRRVDLNVTVPYEIELEKAIKNLENITFKGILKDPKPKVIVKELSDVGVKLKLCTWIDDPWKVASTRSNLAREVNKILAEIQPQKE